MVLLLICAGIFTLSALSARADLRHAQLSAIELQQAIVEGNKPVASKALDSLQSSTHGAHRSTGNILWKVASWAPLAGDSVGAVRDVAAALDEISHAALPPVVNIATQLDLNTFSPRNGQLELSRLATLNDPVAKANTVLAAQKADLDDIHPDDLVGPVRTRVASLITSIDAAADATRITHEALRLIPTMLGSQKRTYLIVFQNNAEIRSTGGLPGSYLIANVSNGKISRGKQGTGSGIPKLTKNAIRITDEEDALYSNFMARFFVDSNFTPEFPRSAQVMKAIIKKHDGVDVDGVISIDPVAMSYILAGTGPARLKDGTVLTAQNAASELLNQSYLRFPIQNGADDFFKDAAAKLFDFVADGHGDTGQTIRGLVRAAKERRIYVWSDKPAEQRQIANMEVAGSLTADKSGQPTLGVFINDATGTKLEYYLRYDTEVISAGCSANGTQTLNARVTLTSHAPANAALLPSSIVTDKFGVSKGDMRMNVLFYLPTGGKFRSAHLDTLKLGGSVRLHNDHIVKAAPITLAPGQTTVLSIVFTTPRNSPEQISVRSTPGAQAGNNSVVGPSACG